MTTEPAPSTNAGVGRSPPTRAPAAEMTDPTDTGGTGELLDGWARGDVDAARRIIERTYADLRRIAGRITWNRDDTLNPTALVAETSMRLLASAPRSFESRAHYLAFAATVMHRLLIDAARRVKAERRGGCIELGPLCHDPAARETPTVGELLDLEDVLQELERSDPRRARLIQLRIFGGMELDDIATVMGLSRATVCRDWRFVRAWLLARLGRSEP